MIEKGNTVNINSPALVFLQWEEVGEVSWMVAQKRLVGLRKVGLRGVGLRGVELRGVGCMVGLQMGEGEQPFWVALLTLTSHLRDQLGFLQLGRRKRRVMGGVALV